MLWKQRRKKNRGRRDSISGSGRTAAAGWSGQPWNSIQPNLIDAFQPLLFAPSELLAVGLADAHTRPLVSPGKRADGSMRSWRTSPDRAWGYPLLEWGRTATSTAALILDLRLTPKPSNAVLRVTMGYGDLPTSKRHHSSARSLNGHLQTGVDAAAAGASVPGIARSKPRQLLALVRRVLHRAR